MFPDENCLLGFSLEKQSLCAYYENKDLAGAVLSHVIIWHHLEYATKAVCEVRVWLSGIAGSYIAIVC